MRKTRVRNFVAGRWVLTVKKDKDGNFQKCKARWVLGFSRQTGTPSKQIVQQLHEQVLDVQQSWLQTITGTCTIWTSRPLSFKVKPMMKPATLFVRFRQSMVIHLTLVLGLRKPGYGLNDAPRRWWQIIDKALLDCGLVPTRADRCTYVLYDSTSKTRTYQPPRSVNTEQVTILKQLTILWIR